jgi:2-polyprenyl-6-methoxyphenol hydroxylase-like FAD-dependent oxidoreductase
VLPIFNRTADACISTLDAQPIQERFDAALLVLTVAQYPTPEVTESVLSLDNALIVYVKIRLLVLRRLREALLPPGLGRQAHRSSLLVIIEREASFRGEDQERWRRALAKEGFLFVRQTPLQGLGEEHPGVMVPVGCLALVFALVGNPSLSSSSSASPGELLLAEDMLAPARTFASASDSDKRRVVIIGGGIGGTCLAGLLQRRGIEAAVFEKDAHQDVRKQGYAITVQQGLHALRALDIDISQVAVSSLSHSSFNADGRLLGAYGCGVRGDLKKQTGNHNFHIPRQRIRQLMADKLVPGTVCWGRRLVSIEEHEDCVDALFDDGSLERAGVLVAADGIHSIIRRDRAAGSLQYLGLLIILGISRHEGSVLEPRRQMQWLDGSARVFTMPFDREQTMWQMSFPLDEEAASRLSRDVCALKQEACARCTYWDPVLVRLLATTSLDCISGHPAYDRDPLRPEQWRAAETLASRVSLLGDAAHPMSPFKGQGANQALIDALTLADALVASVSPP